jgi:hypothetical protein
MISNKKILVLSTAVYQDMEHQDLYHSEYLITYM